MDRYIYGLISKKDANKILKNADVGTFLVRFSDSSAGALAIAYKTVDTQNPVKHYLVKPEDIGSNKTLPDFLREKSIFKSLVKINLNDSKLTILRKDKAFADFVSPKTKDRRAKASQKTGYEQNLDGDL